MMSLGMLFLPESPMIWVLIIAVVFLLFGGSKLPQLAKALGQSKRSFKEGLEESEEKEQEKTLGEASAAKKDPLATIDDETLFEEARRRERLQASGEKK